MRVGVGLVFAGREARNRLVIAHQQVTYRDVCQRLVADIGHRHAVVNLVAQAVVAACRRRARYVLFNVQRGFDPDQLCVQGGQRTGRRLREFRSGVDNLAGELRISVPAKHHPIEQLGQRVNRRLVDQGVSFGAVLRRGDVAGQLVRGNGIAIRIQVLVHERVGDRRKDAVDHHVLGGHIEDPAADGDAARNLPAAECEAHLRRLRPHGHIVAVEVSVNIAVLDAIHQVGHCVDVSREVGHERHVVIWHGIVAARNRQADRRSPARERVSCRNTAGVRRSLHRLRRAVGDVRFGIVHVAIDDVRYGVCVNLILRGVRRVAGHHFAGLRVPTRERIPHVWRGIGGRRRIRPVHLVCEHHIARAILSGQVAIGAFAIRDRILILRVHQGV